MDAHSLRIRNPTPLVTQNAPAMSIANPKNIDPTPILGAKNSPSALGNAPEMTAMMPSTTFNRPIMTIINPVTGLAADSLLSITSSLSLDLVSNIQHQASLCSDSCLTSSDLPVVKNLTSE